MDKERFFKALTAVSDPRFSIGTVNESPLHSALKLYFEPRTELHELNVGGYIADIANEGGCIEIQTRGFIKIKKKLSVLLEQCVVTVVYPVADLKWVLWIDPDTGDVSNRRKSPKRGKAADIFYELGFIKPLLTHPNLRLCVVMLELEEYKYLNGWGEGHKRNATRANRVPLDITGEIHIECPRDYILLIPDDLPESFTVSDFQKAGGVSKTGAQSAMTILREMGIVEKIGTQNRKYLYRIIEAP